MLKMTEIRKYLHFRGMISLTLLLILGITMFEVDPPVQAEKNNVEINESHPILVSNTPYDKYAFGYYFIKASQPDLTWVNKEVSQKYEITKAKQIGIETMSQSELRAAHPVERTFRGKGNLNSKIENVSDQDYEALTRMVQAEAGGEDLQGKILVANVILNRVASKSFPNTITDVVYQTIDGKPQFSPISSEKFLTQVVSAQTIEAVTRALAGENDSQGALFFVARKRSSNSGMNWFESHLQYLFTYGNHEFYATK